MEFRHIGQSSLRVSAIGLGCNNFGGRLDIEATRKVVRKALDLGITLFDTADVYGERGGSETCLGQILGNHRKRIVLATKAGMAMDDSGARSGASRRYLMSAVEESLRRLRTDWIDLYQIHQPDPLTPIEETVRTLDDLIRQGKIRYIGCSNFPAWQMVEAQWTARSAGLSAFTVCQDEYSVLRREIEAELMPAAKANGMGLLPYFPLASGLLTGKYQRNRPMPAASRLTNTKQLADRYLTPRNWSVVEQLDAMAASRGRTLLELALAWLLSREPVSSVIAGATRPEQVEQNIKASDRRLAEDEAIEIDRLTERARNAP